MNRWYCQSLPPKTIICLSMVGVFVFDVVAFAVWAIRSLVFGHANAVDSIVPFLFVGVLAGVIAASILAICRVERFPAVGKDYFEWLATTPWQSSSRTPFGPWHPVVHDLVPLLVCSVSGTIHAVVMAWSMSQRFGVHDPILQHIADVALFFALLPVLIYVFMWCIGGYLSVVRKWDWSIYVPLLVIGLLIHLGLQTSVVAAVSVGVAFFVFAVFAVHRRMSVVLLSVPAMLISDDGHQNRSRLKSSSFRILPPDTKPPVAISWLQKYRPRTPAYALLLLVGLSVFGWDPPALMFALLAVVTMSFARLIVYTESRGTNLSLAARWAIRRLVVPEYDRVWGPTILMLLSGLGLVGLAALGSIPTTVGGVLGIVIPFGIGMVCGPDFEQWSLTAPMRIVAKPESQRRKQPNNIFN